MATAKTPEGVLFSIHVIGDVTGKLYVGEFRAKPTQSFRDKLLADRMRRDLLGPDSVGASGESIVTATVIGELSVRLTDTPQFWKESQGGLGLEDFNVLEQVYKQAIDIEKAHIAAIEVAGKAAEAALREPKKVE